MTIKKYIAFPIPTNIAATTAAIKIFFNPDKTLIK